MAIREIVLNWDDSNGTCQECGLPAAFIYVDAYGPGKHMLCDAICAANFASQGMTIRRIEGE